MQMPSDLSRVLPRVALEPGGVSLGEHGTVFVSAYELAVRIFLNEGGMFSHDATFSPGWVAGRVHHPSFDFAWRADAVCRDGTVGRHAERRGAIGNVWMPEAKLVRIAFKVLREALKTSQGELDLAVLAYEFALRVQAEVIGITVGEARELLANVDSYTKRPLDQLGDPDTVLDRLLLRIVRAHERDRGTLLGGAIDGALNEEELLALSWGLIGAGVKTAGTALAQMVAMVQEAGLMQMARTWAEAMDQVAMRAVVEGVLDAAPPFPLVPLYAAKDGHLGALSVSPGTPIIVCIPASNRGRFGGVDVTSLRGMLTRPPAKPAHLSFGHPQGQHHCSGAALARKLMMVWFQIMFGNMPALTCDLNRFRRVPGLAPEVVAAPVRFDQEAAVSRLMPV